MSQHQPNRTTPTTTNMNGFLRKPGPLFFGLALAGLGYAMYTTNNKREQDKSYTRRTIEREADYIGRDLKHTAEDVVDKTQYAVNRAARTVDRTADAIKRDVDYVADKMTQPSNNNNNGRGW